MKSLSQAEYREIKSLYESVYAPKFESILDDFSDEELEEISEEYIEKEVREFFQECIEEGWEVYTLEQTICESIDSELEVLCEKVDPKETQRRRDYAKSKLSGSKEGSRTKALRRIKGVVKGIGKAIQGGVGLAARAVGTAQRAGSRIKGAAKSGYERGRYGASGKPASSGGSSTSSGGSSTSSVGTSSGGGSSTSSAGTSSDSDSSSSAPATKKRRKDGLLKRGLKKLIRGVSKGVSTAAGAVKAGADYVTDRARKEQINYSDIATIQELYNQIHSSENLDEDFEFLDNFSDEEINDVVEEVVFELLDEGYEIDEIENLFEDTFLIEVSDRYYDSAVKSSKKAAAKIEKDNRKKRRAERIEKVKGSAKGAFERLRGLGRKAKETVKGAGSDAKSSVEKGARKAAKQATVGAEKVKRAASGENRKLERSRRQDKIKMKKIAVANIRKAVTGSSEKARRKDQTGSVGAGAAGTIRSKSGESGNGPSSKGRALGPKGTTSRTDAGNPRRESQIKLTLARAQRSGEKRLAKLNNSFDVFDVVVEFLCDYGIAEDLQEAQWMMVNEVDSEDIAAILEAYGLDEAKGTILSVKGGGKTKYTASKGEQRAAAKSAAERARHAERNRGAKNAVNDARWAQARKKSAEAMNTKPGEDTEDYGNTEQSGDGYYNLRHTNRAARKRRASGR
jgi:hypothetical protein|tara:strand:+ start:22 stop:2064 length:2043 start_codon:yes stop_codon:yes gene_type:complete